MPNNIRCTKCGIILYETEHIHYIEVKNGDVVDFIKLCSICYDKYFDKQFKKKGYTDEK